MSSSYFLGIDYGAKRIGLAVADEASRVATPLQIITTDKKSLGKIVKEIANIARTRDTNLVVIGESKDFNGVDNAIMKKIQPFAAALGAELGESVKIIFEPEFLTTSQAKQLQGDHGLIDASAAALILQSYLDRKNG